MMGEDRKIASGIKKKRQRVRQVRAVFKRSCRLDRDEDRSYV